ncbi:MAG: amidase [Burkholderiaceae bacterium]
MSTSDSESSVLPHGSARDVAAAIRARRLGCVEALEASIGRVRQHDDRINAVVVRDFDRALEAARQLDRLPAHHPDRDLPLFGVPMTVKESFDIEGLPTTFGFPEMRRNIAAADSHVVRCLRGAGAVVFGKTNVPVSLADWQSFNPVYGTTCNPWDPTRVPGGSSGGSAAALAAGFSALEYGSDIGASIRNPAHYCGVFGHKPTYGIVSSDGHALPGQIVPKDISVVGPLARSAGDLALALELTAAPRARDAAAWSVRLPPAIHGRLSQFRVAIVTSDPTADVDESVQAPLRELGEFLAKQGARVDFDARPDFDFDEAHRLYVLMLRAETGWSIDDATFEKQLAQAGELAAADHGYEATMLRAQTLRHREWAWLNRRRYEMLAAWESFFGDWDVLLCPTAATPAFAHMQEGERWERMIDVNGREQPTTTQLFWAGLSCAFFLPGTVAPVALAAPGSHYAGLPVGVQIVGPRFADLTTIRFAELLEREYRGFVAPPDA